MNESTPDSTTRPAPTPRRPFSALRIDARKAAEGVWIKHPDSEDRLRVRRLWCAEHIRAIEQATQDYDAKHGHGKSQTADGMRQVEAVGMATGLVTGWQIAGDEGRPYDPAEMAALLMDPEYADLSVWLRVEASRRTRFQSEHVTGN